MKSSEGARVAGRYAPSPTGSLHLGNLRTALAAYCYARARGGRFLLRIEDIDLPRIKAGAEERQLHDLRMLGIDWDEKPLRQSTRSDVYEAELQRLIESGHAYRCFCSRKDIQQASSAPHRGDAPQAYPGTCSRLTESEVQAKIGEGKVFSWRVRVDEAPKQFDDGFRGIMQIDLQRDGGDFVIKRADGLFAYQLVCAVDDALSGVTEVLRGDDLADSGARQQWLLQLLELPIPRYYHIPLMLDESGNRLSKRNGDADLEHYLAQGFDAAGIVSYLGYTLGQCKVGERVELAQLIQRFELRRIPSHDVRVEPESLYSFRP